MYVFEVEPSLICRINMHSFQTVECIASICIFSLVHLVLISVCLSSHHNFSINQVSTPVGMALRAHFAGYTLGTCLEMQCATDHLVIKRLCIPPSSVVESTLQIVPMIYLNAARAASVCVRHACPFIGVLFAGVLFHVESAMRWFGSDEGCFGGFHGDTTWLPATDVHAVRTQWTVCLDSGQIWTADSGPILVDTGAPKRSILVNLGAARGPIMVNFGPQSRPILADFGTRGGRACQKKGLGTGWWRSSSPMPSTGRRAARSKQGSKGSRRAG